MRVGLWTNISVKIVNNVGSIKKKKIFFSGSITFNHVKAACNVKMSSGVERYYNCRSRVRAESDSSDGTIWPKLNTVCTLNHINWLHFWYGKRRKHQYNDERSKKKKKLRIYDYSFVLFRVFNRSSNKSSESRIYWKFRFQRAIRLNHELFLFLIFLTASLQLFWPHAGVDI